MSTIHGKLRAKKWSVWTEELYSAPGSPGGGDPSSLSSRGSSPLLLPTTEDVMKLNRDDMPTYGQCPSWDGLVLVTCEKCARNVKMESLESHVTLRHGSKSERTAYSKVLAARSAAALRHCQVRLEPVSRSLSETPSTNSSTADKSPLHGVCFGGPSADVVSALGPEMSLLSGSSSSTSPQPVSFPSSPPTTYHRRLASSPGSSSLPVSPAQSIAATTITAVRRPSIRVADSASAPDTRSPSPDLFLQRRGHGEEEEEEDEEGEVVEAMEVDIVETRSQPEVEDEPQDVDMVPVVLPPPVISSSSSFVEVGGQQGGCSPAGGTDTLRYLGDEADSTTTHHNVISIPDTEDIPNIEIGIISGGQVLDSINTKYNVSLLKSESSSPVDSTTTTTTTAPVPSSPAVRSLGGTTVAGIRFGQSGTGAAGQQRIQVVACTADPRTMGNSGSSSNVLQLSLPTVPTLHLAGQPRIISLPIRTSSQLTSQQQQQQLLQQQQPEKMEVDSHPHVAPTHYITVSPLSKTSPKKPAVAGKGGLEKKAGGSREREYDPNKHCGVWDGDAKRNCTRSLTCKSHSVYLKRKVINRSGTFDELLAAHKADKELVGGGGSRPAGDSQGVSAVATSGSAESLAADSQSILARRLQLAPSTPSKTWDQLQTTTTTASTTPGNNSQSSLLKPALIRRPFFQQQQQQQHHQPQLTVSTKEFYCDENLHFSTGLYRYLLYQCGESGSVSFCRKRSCPKLKLSCSCNFKVDIDLNEPTEAYYQ